ncbi:MAG: hypothetical protein AAB483_03560 [Patescibacteria group bacterium]
MDFFNSVKDFVTSVNYTGWQGNIKIIFAVFTFIMLGFAVYSYIKAHLLIQSHHAHDKGHGGHGEQHAGEHAGDVVSHDAAPAYQNYSEHWENILRYANSIRDSEWKLAIIEADKLVDGVLQERGFPGETMGERLMLMAPNQLASLQDLWDAHKLRNLLVHEMNYHMKHEQALAAIRAFERVLRELGAIA